MEKPLSAIFAGLFIVSTTINSLGNTEYFANSDYTPLPNEPRTTSLKCIFSINSGTAMIVDTEIDQTLILADKYVNNNNSLHRLSVTKDDERNVYGNPKHIKVNENDCVVSFGNGLSQSYSR